MDDGRIWVASGAASNPPHARPTSWSQSKPGFCARIALGLILLVASANLFSQRNPAANPTEQGAAFINFLIDTGYLFHLVKITELIVAVLLLSGRFIVLALLLFAPVLVNIILFHVFLQPSGSALALAVTALTVYVASLYRDRFRALLAQ